VTGDPRRQVAGFPEAKRSLLDEKSILTFESNITKPLSKRRNSGSCTKTKASYQTLTVPFCKINKAFNLSAALLPLQNPPNIKRLFTK